jgi:hypothetical protein
MDRIYSEMMARNTGFYSHSGSGGGGGVGWDPLLKTPSEDARRCIALVAAGTIDTTPEYAALLSDMPVSPSSYASPVFHHTFLVAAPWSSEPGTYAGWGNTGAVETLLSDVPAYSLTFDRVIPVKTGIVVCGEPSEPINEHRDRLRAAGFCGESYTLDIAHASLCRWTEPLTSGTCADLMDYVQTRPRVPYAHMDVTHIDIVEASWLMRPQDIRYIKRVHLKNVSTH